jgi:hypothetical protein
MGRHKLIKASLILNSEIISASVADHIPMAFGKGSICRSLMFRTTQPNSLCRTNPSKVKDLRGIITKRGASLALFESKDGLAWGSASHCLGSEFIIPWKNGSQRVDRFGCPQIYMEDGIPKIIAAQLGKEKAFNVCIPLKKVSI